MPTGLRTPAWVVALLVCSTACTTGGSQHATPDVPAPDRSARIIPSATVGGNPIGLRLDRPRAVHRATLLGDGQVLITGGCTEPGCGGFDRGRISEVFDPATRTFSDGPAMHVPRASGTATLLLDGRVLLAGGYPGEGRPPTPSAELFDPVASRFQPLPAMGNGRADHTATLLPDGRVLICGGFDAGGRALRSTELFDPGTGAFTPGPNLSAPRADHAAVLLGSRVVLIGGTATGQAVASTDVLDGGSWSPGPQLRVPRVKHAAVALPNDRILVIGGATSTEGRALLSSTELVDLVARRVTPGPRLSEGEYKLDGAVDRLPDGRVVIAGGERIDVYDPRTQTMAVLPHPAITRRSFRTATVLGPDLVLVAGGYDDAITPTRDAKLVRIPPYA